MKLTVDLHIHTKASDGDLNPVEVLEYAINKNIKYISITDHNTIEGFELVRHMKGHPVNIIPGIELSVRSTDPKATFHLLSYGFDPDDTRIRQFLEHLNHSRKQKTLEAIKILKETHGIPFSENEIDAIKRKIGDVGKNYIADLLVKKGYGRDHGTFQPNTQINLVYKNYIRDTYKSISTSYKPSAKECSNLFISAGGITVLAHYKTIAILDRKLPDLILNNNISGIEVDHSTFNGYERKKAEELATDYNLIRSCGSDFHSFKGRGPNNMIGREIEEEMLYNEKHVIGHLLVKKKIS